MPRRRTIHPMTPAQTASRDGLAYTLWLPADAELVGGILVLHGAGSSKESHYDYARAALPLGIGTVCFDQRGHGESEGAMDDRVLSDTATMAEVLRDAMGQNRPIAVRGSSMGGYLALVAGAEIQASAVVAICPASAEGLRRGLAAEAFSFRADRPALDRFLAAHDPSDAVMQLEMPVLLMHAEGDEQVPVQHSRELSKLLRHPESRLVTLPGGHHRSVQHDHDLQALSLRFIRQAFRPVPAA